MKNKKGSIIVFALIVLSFILIAAFSVAAVTLVERRSANVSVNSSTAFQNADKGMEEFLQQLYKELDQNDDLNTMATELGLICTDGDAANKIPAYMGSDGSDGTETEFIISAYQETTPDPNDPAGWRTLEPIADCNTALADVSRFKAAGNFNNAARAVFLKLRDSLTRGLVAHWSLEDRAQIARIIPESDRGDRISFIAQDSSKQNHTLTLCGLAVDSSDADAYPIPVDFETDEGSVSYEIEEFSDCPAVIPGNAGAMSPYRGYGDSDDSEYDANGAWVEGVVEEQVNGVAGALGDSSSTEALYFDGNTYLAMYTDNNCSTDTINCIDASAEDKLLLDEGVAISMWVKKMNTVAGAEEHLFIRRDGSNDVELYLSGEKVCFRLGTAATCTANKIGIDDWHHIAVKWRQSGGGHKEIWVDGEESAIVSGSSTFPGPIGKPDTTMYIGADVNGNPTLSEAVIDDVRVWDRALSSREIWRLCTEAESDDGIDHQTTGHPAGCPPTAPTT